MAGGKKGALSEQQAEALRALPSVEELIEAPELVILGVSRSAMRPVYKDGQFVPRLMLPLSLSYDHRVIDGALAARFTTYLASVLSDIRRVLL